ncbi:DUF6082 family protein [Kitasatospora sp. NPDC096204]|uniref:DUF6082 family protein n=1 Tax=Kitasatospora sp. NPDC096204 TaxID=3364094 RepID=UPI003818253D
MKVSSAVLLLAGAVVGQAAVGYYQHRQRVEMDLGLDHQQRINESLADDEYRAFGSEAGSLKEQKANLRVNKILAYLSLRWRMGVITREELRVNLRSLVDDSTAQAYWRQWGAFRLDEAMAGDWRLRAIGRELVKAFGEPLRPELISELEAGTPQSTAA